MVLFDRLRALLSRVMPDPGADPNSLWIYVQCARCGESIRARIDLRNEPSLAEDDAGYVVRKGLSGSGANRCFQAIEVTLRLDSSRQHILESQVSGGRLISAHEFEEALRRRPGADREEPPA
jgi:hypothetical protein